MVGLNTKFLAKLYTLIVLFYSTLLSAITVTQLWHLLQKKKPEKRESTRVRRVKKLKLTNKPGISGVVSNIKI